MRSSKRSTEIKGKRTSLFFLGYMQQTFFRKPVLYFVLCYMCLCVKNKGKLGGFSILQTGI